MEEDQFLLLLNDNKGIILKICNVYCYNKTDREDLAQEITYTLWKGRATYNPALKYTTWMYRVALNVAISFYRASVIYKKKLQFARQESETKEDVSVNPDPDDKLSQLQFHIAALNELDKALVILYLEDNSYKEISEVLGITETNVATRLSRIKEKLKKGIIKSKPNNNVR